MFLEPVRAGLQQVMNLHCTSEEKEDDLSLIICRSHPDDCEKILSPPYLLHAAYDAIRWLDHRLDSETFGSSPIDPLRSIINSFEYCCDDRLTHIVLLSCHYENETLSVIAKSTPKEVAFTFYPVCFPSDGENEELKQFNFTLQADNCNHRVDAVVPSPDAWESVFRDIRELLLQPTDCILDLTQLMEACSRTRTEFVIRPFLERLILPSIEKVCSCHGRTLDQIADPSNCVKAVRIGSEFFSVGDQELTAVEPEIMTLTAKCFVNIGSLCETKLSGPVFIGWQTEADELFEALKRSMIRRKLGLILEREEQDNTAFSFSRRYFMAFTDESSLESENMEFSFALIREMISTDQNLIGWRMKNPAEVQSVDNPCDKNLHPLFAELCRDFSSVLFHSSFHDQMRNIITTSSTFVPKNRS